jgi:transketolase
MTGEQLGLVRRLAAQLRVDSIRCSTEAGSGHPTSSLSAADLMAVLLAGHLRYDWDRPHLASNDHLIFSKGHASPLLYSIFRAAGVVSEDELIQTYRQLGARLQGHPTPRLPWVDVATGSLGQGLPDAVGVCLAGRYLDKLPYHVWVLCGDSETAEGSIWEALDKASYYKLGNLTAIIDVNRLGQRGPTELEWDLDRYAARVEAFGCRPLVIDGHDPAAIDQALTDARSGADRSAGQDHQGQGRARTGGQERLARQGPPPGHGRARRRRPGRAERPADHDLPPRAGDPGHHRRPRCPGQASHVGAR